jgi:hypothetical protein
MFITSGVGKLFVAARVLVSIGLLSIASGALLGIG